MILRLIIAFARWTWGVSPAFVTPKEPLCGWGFAMMFGVLLDISVIFITIMCVVITRQYRRKK